MSESVEIEENESENLTVDGGVGSSLGEPDFNELIDDDEITPSDFDGGGIAKAKKGLKPSFAVKKLMPLLFSVIARAKGEHWILQDKEVEEFSDSLDDCLEYYYPELDGLPPWAMLALSGGFIMMPRLMIDGLSDDEKKALEEAQKDALPDKKQDSSVVGHGTVLQPKAVS